MKKKKKGRRMGSVNGETPLPEAIIQHIQSFMSGIEAAQTTLLSKSWYNAWLTRPSLDLDNFQFPSKHNFDEFATKTMQRYQDLNIKIDSFRLRMFFYHGWSYEVNEKLIVRAMKMGATHVELKKIATSPSLILPQELLGSQTLVSLSITHAEFKGNYVISCSTLKSLTLNNVTFTSSHVFKDIILSCISIEELSLSCCGSSDAPNLRWMNLCKLHKLRRLFLAEVDVDNIFFTEFASRFPCLKDLSILLCRGYTSIQIATTSLETISFKTYRSSWKAKFDVPNIRKFTYSCSVLPSQLSIKGASREWEFDISIACNQFHDRSWFLTLKKCLTRFRLSRITLSMRLRCGLPDERYPPRVYSEVKGEPLAVENLMIDAPSSFCSALLIRLFGAFRPNFITHSRLTDECNNWFFKNESLDILCMRLMQQPITPNCGIPNQNMFGQLNLKKVNVEVYEMFGAELRPLVLKKPLDASKAPVTERKVWFELIWDD